MAESYYELLRRPEWQRKRLEVMEAAGFKCGECRASEKTLNVHHRFYRKGAKPWEYEPWELVCLCEECHGRRTRLDRRLRQAAGFLTENELLEVLGLIDVFLLMTWRNQLGPGIDRARPPKGQDEEGDFCYAYGLAKGVTDFPSDYRVSSLATNISCEMADEGIDHETLLALAREAEEAFAHRADS